MSTYTDYMCKSLIQTVLIENKDKIETDNFLISFNDENGKVIKDELINKNDLENFLSTTLSDSTKLAHIKNIVINNINKKGEKIEITSIDII